MMQWLTLSRASRLIGVARSELQRQIREGRLPSNDGLVSTAGLLALYPDFRLEDTGAFEQVARIKEQAFGRRVFERALPGREVLAQRLYAHSQELADARRHLARYHALVVAAQQRIDALAGQAPDEHWRELQAFVTQGLAEVLATESADALTILDDMLKVVSARVTVRPSGREFDVEGRDTLLQAGLKAGLKLNYGCGNGTCGLCKARVVSGEVVKVTPYDYPLSAAERLHGYTLLCAHSAGSAEIVLEALEAMGPREIPTQQLTVRVRAVQRLAAGTLLLHVQTPRSSRLRFLAGQGVALTVSTGTSEAGYGDANAPRTYPIASCPCDDRNLHFHVARDEGDPLAQQLFAGAIRTGDSLSLWGPTGDFVLAEGDRPLTFLACDTGFAPVKSLIEHAMAVDATETISLDWVAVRPDGQYLANQCRAWAAALDGFRYVARAAADPAAGAATAVAALAADLPLPERNVYIAGPQIFVTGALAALADTGVPAGQLFASIV
jgi:CDP-4-dehydro-6-deoxyglucose reductase, E3